MKTGISIALSPLALKQLDRIVFLTESNRSAVIERFLRELPVPTDAIVEKCHCKILLGIPCNHKTSLAYVANMAGLEIKDIKQDDIDNVPSGVYGVMLAALAVENALIRSEKCEKESMSPDQSTE